MPYSLLIGLGAGLVSAVVFASATTGPLLLAPAPLPADAARAVPRRARRSGRSIAVVAGIAGTAIVLGCRQRCRGASCLPRARRFPPSSLVYLASLNRTTGRRPRRMVSGRPHRRSRRRFWPAPSRRSRLFLLGGDIDTLRSALRGHAAAVRQQRAAEDAGRADARAAGDRRGDRRSRSRCSPPRPPSRPWAASCSTCGSPDASRCVGAPAAPMAGSGRHRLSRRHAAAACRGDGRRLPCRHAGPDRCRLRRSAVLRLRAAGPCRRPLHDARALLAPLRAVGPLPPRSSS